jgi:phytoene dehydrogenase-like protein
MPAINLEPLDGSPEAVRRAVDHAYMVGSSYLDKIADWVKRPVAGMSILELGPGPDFGSTLLLTAFGAKVAVSDRWLTPWQSHHHAPLYQGLADRIAAEHPGADVAPLRALVEADAYLPDVIRLLEDAERMEEAADSSFDMVVSNADAEHLYRDLLPDRKALRRVHRSTPSTSGFVVLVGATGATPDIAHHNVWFSSDGQREFAQIADGRLADEPTVYACVSSVTDASQAPAGDENWFLLVNTPAGVEVDRDAYSGVVLDVLARRGIDLRGRARFTETITPHDLEQRYRAPGGAIYGSSSDGRRAAFVRPANRGSRPGLYLVGGSSHPGGGLPLVTMSARIVADMITGDLVTGDLTGRA